MKEKSLPESRAPEPVTRDFQGQVRLWPVALPDETLFSVVEQFHAATRGGLAKRTMIPLFGNRSIFLAGGFPTHLGTLQAYLGGLVPTWTEERLLHQFTFLPYLQCFCDKHVSDQVKALMLGSDGRGIKALIGWVASRLGAAEPLRACPSCYEDDYLAHGRPYWHRAHQLPGVSACHLHEINLVRVPGPAEGIGRFVPFPPPASVYAASRDTAPTFARQFADCSYAFLADSPLVAGPAQLNYSYRERLAELGYLTKGGRVRQRSFQTWAQHELRQRLKDVPENLQNLAWKTHEDDWLAKLLRKPSHHALHPVKHIMLLLLLFDDVATFCSALAETRAAPPAGIVAEHCRDERILSARRSMPNGSLRELSGQLGLSVTTLAIALSRLGQPVDRRPKTLTQERITAVRRDLAQGSPVEAIARAHGVSLGSAYRILRADPDTKARRGQALEDIQRRPRRAAVAKWIDAHPNSSLRELLAARYKDVAWLRRHDVLWLKEALRRRAAPKRAERPQIDWSRRDATLLGQMKDAHTRLLSLPGPPCRITAIALTRETHAAAWLKRVPEKLPLSTAFIQAHVDSRESFVRRRLIWAVRDLESAGFNPSQSAVIRHARIRPPPEATLREITTLCAAGGPNYALGG